jgi:hypothetical protein
MLDIPTNPYHAFCRWGLFTKGTKNKSRCTFCHWFFRMCTLHSDSAYELYADLGGYRKTTKKTNHSFLRKRPSDTATQNSKTDNMADRFKRTFSREGVRVHFIGVWCVI